MKKALRAIGFEGTFPTKGDVTWGAVALEDEKGVFNPHTNAYVTDIEALVEGRYLTKFVSPITLRNLERPTKAIAVLFRTNGKTSAVAKGDFKKVADSLATGHTNDFDVMILSDLEAFSNYARVRTQFIVDEILKQTQHDAVSLTPSAQDLLRAGLVLNSRDPALNAIRTRFSSTEDRDYYRDVALATFGDDDLSVRIYEKRLKAMDTSNPFYELLYKGAQADEGFGIDQTIEVLGALSRAFTLSDPANDTTAKGEGTHIEKKQPLADFQKAASVMFRLSAPRTTNMFERTLWAERFAELTHAVSHGGNDWALQTALEKLLAEHLATEISHRSSGDTFVPIVPSQRSVAKRHMRQLTTLAWVSGVRRGGTLLELVLPARRGSLTLNAENDGTGEKPVGLALVKPKSLLFTAVVVRLSVHLDNKLTWYLRELTPVVPGVRFDLTGFASSLAGDCLAYNIVISSEVRKDKIVFGDRSFQMSPLPGDSASGPLWLHSIAAALKALEQELAPLKDTKSVRYFPSKTEFTLLDDLIGILLDKDAPARYRELMSDVFRQTGSFRRDNNIAKEVRNHAELFVRQGATTELSQLGRAKGAALKKAGWRLKSSSEE